MVVESSQQPMPDEQPAKMPALMPKNGAAPADADPELLRWRAEILLDEMMLGGVDVAAGEPLNRNAWPSQPMPSPASSGSENSWDTAAGAPAVAGAYENGHVGGMNGPGVSGLTEREGASVRAAAFERTQPAQQPEQPSAAPTPSPSDRQSWVASAEERYRKLARQQEQDYPPTTPAEPATNDAGDYLWPEESRTTPPAVEATATMSTPTVRRVANQFAGSVATVASGGKRSNLLPRMSTADVEAVQREIFTLQSEIDVRLPANHESNERARHLLEKALAILQADATRSAEVEYYLQQVRTIFQRVQQTIDWSSIYRNRLLVYLSAWVLLTVIVLTASTLYRSQLENALILYAGLAPEGLALQHGVALIAACFAGALGGAISMLVSLQHQSHLPHGFIDRKFGLRGLLLPLLGAAVGGLIALLLSLIYTVIGINPAQSLLAAALPALLAFLFGVGQETLYGTRD
ncbi:MAG: hypothetical protein DCC55_17075 [Chloroflexi bacterium]|nr:MAG: hypothetical protein DCC55_17075 [Chloroflexota bacterium]